MEEEMLSMISNGRTNAIAEASDSNSTTSPLPATKPANRNVAFTKFKGVVPHQNGHWGAQIYANHQRIWLGTFKTEKEAAMAYDSAAIKLRSGDSHRNYPWTSITVEEPIFQNLHSTEVVLNMIKDGSYQSKFADFLMTHSLKTETEIALNTTRVHTNDGLIYKQLFQKELTPSDVGKLNRLVIPKKYAIKYFPRISEDAGEGGAATDDMQLVFYDRLMRTWKFRYCYWRSSQSFVFTRGWNRFVREKELKANDLIIFYMCESKKEVKQGWTFCMIDINKENNGGEVEGAGELVGLQLDMRLQSGQNGVYDNDEDEVEEDEEIEEVEEAAQDAEGKGFRLFGVHIS